MLRKNKRFPHNYIIRILGSVSRGNLAHPSGWGILAHPPAKKKTKAHNGFLKTALETLKGIHSSDKKLLARKILPIPY